MIPDRVKMKPICIGFFEGSFGSFLSVQGGPLPLVDRRNVHNVVNLGPVGSGDGPRGIRRRTTKIILESFFEERLNWNLTLSVRS